MIKEIKLNDWDLEQIKENGHVQSGDLVVIRLDIWKKIFDDTFIQLDKGMLKKFKEFCKATADNNDLKKVCSCGHKISQHNQGGCQVVHGEGDDDIYCACEQTYP